MTRTIRDTISASVTASLVQVEMRDLKTLDLVAASDVSRAIAGNASAALTSDPGALLPAIARQLSVRSLTVGICRSTNASLLMIEVDTVEDVEDLAALLSLASSTNERDETEQWREARRDGAADQDRIVVRGGRRPVCQCHAERKAG